MARVTGSWLTWVRSLAAKPAVGPSWDGPSRASRARPERSLFDPPDYDEPDDDEPVLVKLRDIRRNTSAASATSGLARGLWRLLELDVLLERIMPSGREEIPWSQMAAILTIARLCEPSSELHIEDTWYRGTALDDLLGIPAEKVHTDRLYTGLDRLLPTRMNWNGTCGNDWGTSSISSTNYCSTISPAPISRASAPPIRWRGAGYSRDSRPDCLQVLISLVVTEDGFPLGYEIFVGNRNDSKTVDEMITAMERKHGQANRIWVMDRGMVSQENIARLHRSNASYIVGTPKALLRQFERELTDHENWHTVQEGLDVKQVASPDGKEVFILARSVDRQAKEQAMHQRFWERLDAGLHKLDSAMKAGRLHDEGLANRRLGRLLEKNWRAAGAFDIRIERLPQPVEKARLKITWQRNPSCDEWTRIANGCYILRSNLCDVEPATLWKRYIQLTEAEVCQPDYSSSRQLLPVR